MAVNATPVDQPKGTTPMAIGTNTFGRGDDIETTDKMDRREGFIERAQEFIAHPSIDRHGHVTHSADAELGYDPADFPGIQPKVEEPPVEPETVVPVAELPVAEAPVAEAPVVVVAPEADPPAPAV